MFNLLKVCMLALLGFFNAHACFVGLLVSDVIVL